MTLAPVEERGTTVVAERVVTRLATELTGEVGGIGGAARRVAKVAIGAEDFERDAQVSAGIDGDTATIAVRCSVAYPASVATATENLRDYLTRRVGELTGLRVRRVDITVTALHTMAGRRVR